MNAQQFAKLSTAFAAIGDAARNAERRGDDLADHSISHEEHAATAAAMQLVRDLMAAV